MPKYKAGDKVKYVGNGGVFEHGEILTVKADDGCPSLPLLVSKGNAIQWVDYSEVKQYKSKKSLRIKTLKQKISTLESQVAELQAEVAALKKAKATPKFVTLTTDSITVGDKIRVINADEIGPAVLTNGKMYEVTHVDSDGDFYVVDDEGDEMSIVSAEFHAVEKMVSE